MLAAFFAPTQNLSDYGFLYLTVIPLLSALLLSDPHNAATLVRLYGDSTLSKKLSWLTYLAPLIFALLAIACMVYMPLLAVALRLYLVFIAQHSTMQAYGVALAYCQKQGFSLNGRERDILKRAFFSTAIYAMVHQLEMPIPGISYVFGASLASFAFAIPHLPAWILYATSLFLGFALLELACMLVTRLHCKWEYFPAPALLILSTCLFIFLVPPSAMPMTWLFIPAFFHATQYLCVTGRYTMNKLAQAEGLEAAPSFFSSAFWGYGLQLFAVGLTLFVLLPALPKMFGVTYSISYAAIFCAVNLHHFCADFVLWRLRDPALRQLIVS